MKKITERWLRNHEACTEKLATFRELFGREAEVSYENFKIWTKHPDNKHNWMLDIDWLLDELFAYTKNKRRIRLFKRLTKYMEIEVYREFCYFAVQEMEIRFSRMTKNRAITGIVQVLWQA